ncbi:MAG: bifunctional alpha,alpha-trehalose-phosphate synthase (UDP-forming)/trehalose-phosphatase [Bifidobacterium sp.]|jgi:trehalose 6-phosphate synthase/phosphatase|nr:bifunctional alpha,alpha-trehalose-phosphate synthase (UDP-forming)/trehalose-phosphatase [Bifidobacterium sp.]MCI1865217.1 bifunctional alpha,alpha-trehalose-phosphate synthase (UDP-forming)/trehalose-phosphatase [Bifidobacterium sp.]
MSLDTEDDGSYTLRQNIGGLATAIGPYHKEHHDCLWVGWSGSAAEDNSEDELKRVRKAYEDRRCVPIFLSQHEIDGYYAGFSNDTLWPLFHDFGHEATFDPEDWQVYCEVNQRFADVLAPLIHKGDTIWIQDYHLMLLPRMLRERFPQTAIGWFLHVPFPSPEIFRSLPWSREILEGVLGADLLGFHTVDYAASFKAAVGVLLNYECPDSGAITLPDGHVATVDAFPIGIDYNLYSRTAKSTLARSMRMGIEQAADKRPGRVRRYRVALSAEGDAVAEAIKKEGSWWSHNIREELPELTLARSAVTDRSNKVIVSVDRLDYTKGIPERLRAYERMLEKYPEWTGHVTYYLLATPSREKVETYKRLKEQVDQLVGQINGRYSLLSWTPIHYITRSLPIKPVCGIYAAGDVALVTPLRDGMNLVAKEYLACHDGRSGALVLSDMCGAARELTQAFIVNPYDTEAVAEALHDALEIDPAESRRRNICMQAILKVRTASSWCTGFLSALRQVTDPSLADRRLRMDQRDGMMSQWSVAKRRLLLCDYDGTLTPLVRTPARAKPTRALASLLRRVGSQPGVDLVIVSGRSHETMEQWFGNLPVSMIAEHGAWNKDCREGAHATWLRSAGLPEASRWKPVVRSLMDDAVVRAPKSFVEVKDDAMAWHYRLTDGRHAESARQLLLDDLRRVVSDLGLRIMENAKVVEVCPVVTSKGNAVGPLVESGLYDFVLAIGDDVTDETMFSVVPEPGWTIKVGAGITKARSRLLDSAAFQRLLSYLAAQSQACALESD